MALQSSVAVHQRIPFWRDVRVLKVLSQVIFVLIVIFVLAVLYTNMTNALQRRGLSASFDFLWLEAGFEIGEGIAYKPSDSYGRAFLVGVVNTLRVTVVGIMLATILGVITGVARLSSNWLVNKIASVYIEVIRNTPLLVQLVFWYYAVIFKAPLVQESWTLPGPIYISRRGVAIPWPNPTPAFSTWLSSLAASAVIAVILWLVLSQLQRRTGRATHPVLAGTVALVGIAALGWVLAGGKPITWDVPELGRFNFSGGLALTPEFFALLVGLVVYTAAFIAEVVRGGILSVQRGQIEAARALGLSEMQILRLIIFPQALRVIIPPLTSQYLNLAKNSSLAVAIGYPDLFSVGGTIANQTGRPVPVIILIMGSYLTMSLLTSLFMNIYNRKIAFVQR